MSITPIVKGRCDFVYVAYLASHTHPHPPIFLHAPVSVLLFPVLTLTNPHPPPPCPLQDSVIDELRKSNQWFIHCILPHRPHKFPHALGAVAGEVDKASVYGCLDVPLVWAQLKRSDLVKVARLYKQGG